jgi:gluconate 2-dehydrogenase gamma chain
MKKQNGTSRRSVLAGSLTGLSSAWLATHWPEILVAQQQARDVAKSGGSAKLEFLTPEQATEVEAVAAQIIPSDSTPGAREARSVYFIDRALTTFDRAQQSLYTQGLHDLQAKTREISNGTDKFSSLTSAQQIQLLKGIDQTPFFNAVRTHTIIGYFANPEYGGNEGKAGWKLLGFDDKFNFKPPFGYYDRDSHRA